MNASYGSIDGWLRKAEAAGTTTVLTIDLASVFGISKSAMAGLARRGEFGPSTRDAGRFHRVQLGGVRAFLEKYKCAFLGWVSLSEASRLSGAKRSTLVFWLNCGAIAGSRDMHGRVRLDPASLSVAREYLRWTRLPDELTLQGVKHYSLAHLARGLTARSGMAPDDASFDRAFRRNYTMFYRWMTQTPLREQVQRVGRRRALYIPWPLYEKLVDTVRPQEAAVVIGETPHMLQYWARRGRIGFVQFAGTQKMVPREELDAFLEYRRATAQGQSRSRSPRQRQRPGGEPLGSARQARRPRAGSGQADGEDAGRAPRLSAPRRTAAYGCARSARGAGTSAEVELR
jgi:hypothetical protein